MHTTEWRGRGKLYEDDFKDNDIVVVMHHNGDYSGEVRIEIDLASSAVDPYSDPTQKIVVPFAALVKLVGSAVLDQKIRELEQTEPKDILGL